MPKVLIADKLSPAAVAISSYSDLSTSASIATQLMRGEVSPKSQEWGYRLGSVYIRKVHFRDKEMIQQIEEKVVNRLRQVTSSIKQSGANQVSVITSTAERQAAVEFAKAAAMRPRIVGDALNQVAADPDVEAAMFEILEIQKLVESKAKITLVPERSGLLPELLVAGAKEIVLGHARYHQGPPPAGAISVRRDDKGRLLLPSGSEATLDPLAGGPVVIYLQKVLP